MTPIKDFAPQSVTGGYRLDEILAIAEVALAYANRAHDVDARRGLAAWETLRGIAYGNELVSNAKAEGAINALFGISINNADLLKRDVPLYKRGAAKMQAKMDQWATDSDYARLVAKNIA